MSGFCADCPDHEACATGWPCDLVEQVNPRAHVWNLRLPLARPLTLNQRQHWAAKARDTAQLRGDTATLARQARIPRHHQVSVKLTYYPPDRRRRDADNLVATLKAACDGLVDAGIVPDDVPEHMVKCMPVIVAPDPDSRLVLTVKGIVR